MCQSNTGLAMVSPLHKADVKEYRCTPVAMSKLSCLPKMFVGITEVKLQPYCLLYILFLDIH